MKNKQKGDVLVLLLVVLALIVLAMWYNNKHGGSQTTDNSGTTNTQNTDITNTGYVPPPGMSIGTINYGQALVKYADARIQLDQNCTASPSSLTFKNDTYIMIDNRSSITRTITIGRGVNPGFNVSPYGFKIVRLLSATTPVTWGVDCGASTNVASILIQQ